MSNLITGILWVWLMAAILIPLLSYFLPWIRLDQFALLGDSLGTVNTLFSALAVILVLVGLREQQREILEMRSESERRILREMRAATPVLEVTEGVQGVGEADITYVTL
jgi:hypothetical protein